jgi:hypothetical protein
MASLRAHLLVILLSGLSFWAGSVYAEEPATGEQPDIVIREEEDKTFYEYRVGGVLKEIKVVPKIGPAYYLVPADGDGWIREERSQILVPKWVLFEW